MEKEKFNQAKYMREWQKENMKQVAMQDMIEKANNI